MFLALILIAFICIPIFELWMILQVGDVLGVWPTIALLIGTSVLGAMLLRSQGQSVWLELKTALNAGKLPAREVINGGFVIIGGVMLITPGFMSDIFGLLMLAPPTRKVFGDWVYAFISRRVRLAAPFVDRAADTGLRDFPRSSQPPPHKEGAAARARRGQSGDPTESAPGAEADPEFDFETRRLNH